MARVLSVSEIAETSKIITSPLYILKLDVGTGKRYSSRQAVDFEGDTFQPGVLSSLGITNDSASFKLVYDKFLFSDFLIAGIQNITVSIWILYGEGSAIASGTKLFHGLIESMPAITERFISIKATNKDKFAMFTPSITCSKPLMNHMPAAGTKIGDTEQIILEAYPK